MLRGHCETLGTDFDAITRSSNFNTVIGTDAADVARRLDAIEARVAPYLGPEKTARYMADFHSPHRRASARRRRSSRSSPSGASSASATSILYFPEAAYDRSGLELFASEVIPALH